MATESIAAPYGEVKSAVASKGVSLSGTASRTVIPAGTRFISMVGTTYSTAVVVRILFNPWLTIFKTSDGLATQANITDYSLNAQDNSTATDVTLSSLDTIANLDAVYVGSWTQFSGVAIDVDAANGNASVLTVKYRKSDNTWATTSATDGTDSAGASMGTDGSVTWTVPTDWIMHSLADSDAGVATKDMGIMRQPMFWTRWEFSAALDSTTTQNSWASINRSTEYIELPTGLPWEQSIQVGPGGFHTIQAATDAGTALLLVNCASRGRFA